MVAMTIIEIPVLTDERKWIVFFIFRLFFRLIEARQVLQAIVIATDDAEKSN